MLVTRRSRISGVERTLELDVTQAQIDLWQAGELIQRAMPQLSRQEREFVMTGMTQQEWDATFGDDDA